MSKDKSKGATYAALLGSSRDADKSKYKKDSPCSRNNSRSSPQSENSQRKRCRSPSPRHDKKKEKTSTYKAPKKNGDYDIPDRSFGDLYCKICDSHMNSEGMWAAHIIGKRHLKNTRGGGDTDLKYDYLDEPPSIQDVLDQETEPVVGLQHMCEIQRLEQKPIYQCFLCSANVPTVELLKEHIKSLKHRLAYLKEHDPNRYEIIHSSDLKKGHLEPVVEECVAKHEADLGRGKMNVKRERCKVDTWKKSGSYKDYNHSGLSHKNERPDGFDYRSREDFNQRSRDDFNQRSRDDINQRSRDDFNQKSRDDFNQRSRDSFGYSEKSNDYHYRDREREHTPPYSDKGNWRIVEDAMPRDIEETYEKRDQRMSYSAAANEKGRDSVYYNNSSNYEKLSPALPTNSNYNRIRSGDLREVLEQKKALEYSRQSHPLNQVAQHTNQVAQPMNQVAQPMNQVAQPMNQVMPETPTSSSTLDVNIPDHVLGMFSALPTVSFFQLVLFKLDEIKVENDIEIKLLDRISNKTATMAMDIKTKLMTPTLREKFQESMIQNTLDINQEKEKYSADIKKLMDLVGDYRAKSDLKSQNISTDAATFQNSSSASPIQPVQKTPYKSTVSTYSNTAERKDERFSQPLRDTSYSTQQGTSYMTPQNVSYPRQQNNTYTSWKPLSPPSFSNSPTSIPGLTFVSDETSPEKQMPSNISPFDHFARKAKDILGHYPISSNQNNTRY